VADFVHDLSVNLTSAYAAAHEAVAGFKILPADTSRSFIYTGNCLNVMPMPIFLTLGVGKTAVAHVIQNASTAYKDTGMK
jgi:hypothetical protein